ncbi:MAG: UDP-GlcNAc:undecaprenyl-phosphate/decaprenyl-phosphate GlcNAc-phosphate transferase [Thermodesulfobacteriota bacterium]|nr:UDP-GlcNAc:undecaprenyl-phosphate/decaprenyl-phosphate GlcNAc-phosphate transferase [Thermodesulfobacteriota bacterium]
MVLKMPLYFYLSIFGVSCLLSLILTPLARRLAIRWGQVAVPKDNRWHRKETALLGGVSIFMAMITVWVLAAGLTNWSAFGQPYLVMILCSGGIFVLGLIDDIFNMDPQHKLAGQVIITAILIFFGYRLGWTDSKTLNLFLSILWIVGITNAFNLLDNMDGLAPGIALIAGGFLFLWLYLEPVTGQVSAPVLLALSAYLGAVSGFLVYNFNPASIFMGDAGSLFVGFVLACLTVAGTPSQVGSDKGFLHLLSVIAIPVLILFIPILDTGFVSLMRKLFRRPISQGGRDHSSHRLVAIGFSERKAVLVLYAFSAASGLMALAINRLNIGTSLVLIAIYLLFIIFFWIYLARVKVYSETSILSGEVSGLVTPLLIDMTFKRRIFEVLLDLVLITVAYYTAYLLRFEGAIGPNFDFFLHSLPIVIACQILFFYLFGIYRGVWENTSVRDLISYGKAITAGTVSPILILLFIYRFYSFSRAVFVIYWGLMLITVSLSRLSFRLLDEGIRGTNREGRRVLVYGAGLGGQMALREIETNRDLGLRVVGFMDDNPRIQQRKIRGYPVLGGLKNLDQILSDQEIQEIIISFKMNSSEKKREIKRWCEEMGVEVDIKEMRLTIS